MDYQRLYANQAAAMMYIESKINEFGNAPELANYKEIFMEIGKTLLAMDSRIAIIEKLERDIQVQMTIVDILQQNIELTPCEHNMVDMKYRYASTELSRLLTELKINVA